MDYRKHELYQQYEALWQAALPRVRQGDIDVDQRLARKERDQRRGLTVIARLAPDIVARIGELLQALAVVEPRQYYYPQADLHLTVLSLFTATEQYQSHLDRLDDYRDAVASALRSTPSFAVDMVGITVAPGAVLLQGFPTDGTLNKARDRLREALIGRGLDTSLDQRYRLVTAHSTLVRFAAPLAAPEQFADALTAYRYTSFGRSVIASLDLVLNDWYMSSDTLTQIAAFQLQEQHTHA
ncbi:MAG TPA: 2'-5' RNA ligase family protein [Roseiflexaceae bacterium]|nr:2'-5' RNA ligase family protein [Roseiflexaceae bacterium]